MGSPPGYGLGTTPPTEVFPGSTEVKDFLSSPPAMPPDLPTSPEEGRLLLGVLLEAVGCDMGCDTGCDMPAHCRCWQSSAWVMAATWDWAARSLGVLSTPGYSRTQGCQEEWGQSLGVCSSVLCAYRTLYACPLYANTMTGKYYFPASIC